MNIGGGSMEVDTNSDDNTSSADNKTLHSAYVVFDITNPESAPKLLGEIPVPDNSFTTVFPAVVAFKDAEKDSAT
jgi:type IV pilus assembly protein PilY1